MVTLNALGPPEAGRSLQPSPSTVVAGHGTKKHSKRGAGAAKSGTAHWWAMKATSLALIPLTLWMLGSMIGLQGATRAQVAAWAGGPITATLLLATIAALFHHMYLGVQTVIEDYIQDERPRIAWLMATPCVSRPCAATALLRAPLPKPRSSTRAPGARRAVKRAMYSLVTKWVRSLRLLVVWS